MQGKKKTDPTLTRQRNAAEKARLAGKWETAMANYTRALAHKPLSTAIQIELLEGRAACFKQTGDAKAAALDLRKLSNLLKTRLDENSEVLHQSQAELGIIASIAEALVDQADYASIGRLVGQKVQEFFNAEVAWADLYNDKSAMFDVVYAYVRGELKQLPPFKYGRGLASHVLKTRRPLYIATRKDFKKYGRMYLEDVPSKSGLVAPLIAGRRALGAIAIEDSKPNAYSKHDLHILHAIANSTSVALENARLFNETRQRNAELAVINAVQAALAEKLDIQSIYDMVGEKLREIFDVGAITINVYDLDANTNSYVYGFEDGKRTPNITIPINKLHHFVLGQGRTFLLNTGAQQFFKRFGAKAPQGKLPKSALSVLLREKTKQVTAVVLMDIENENAFAESDVRLLETLANTMQVALENARLFDETRQRNAELAVINSVQAAMAKQKDIQGIYEAVGEKIKDIFDAQSVVLTTSDLASNLTVYHYVYEKGERLYPDPKPFTRKRRLLYSISRRKTWVINEDFDAKAKEFDMKTVAGEMPKSAVFVPLVVADKRIGSISIQNIDRENAFSASDVRLLETLANSMSVALENARLFDETTQRNAELAVINSVQAALAEQLDIQAIYDTVGEKLREIFDVGTITINVYDLNENTNSYVYGFEDRKRDPNITVPINKMHRSLLDGGRSVLINQGFQEYADQFGARAPQGKLPKSLIWLPLPKQGKRITAVALQDTERENAFPESDVRLLETLASSMAVALENARLFDEIQKSNREISEALEQQRATSDILRAMASSPTEIQPVLEAVAQQAARLCEANDVQIYKVDGEQLRHIAHFGPLPTLQVGEALPLVPGLVTGRAVLERRTIHIEDILKLSEEYPQSVKFQKRLGHRTMLSTPLLREGEAVGALVVRRDVVRPFTEKQIALLATFADQAAIAIDNVRLFDELQTRNREITEALELQTATSDILEAIASSPQDIDGILRTIAEKAALLIKSDDAVIVYVEGGFFEVRAHVGSIPFDKLGEGIELNRETVTGRAIIDGKPIQAIHNPKGKKSEFPLGDQGAIEFGYAMTCAAPLLLRGEAAGAIMIRRLEPILFSEKEISLLQNFANQAVIAIEKARLLNETKRLLEETTQRNAELAVINSVQQGLASKLKFQEIIDLVGEKVGEIFNADTVFAIMYDAQRDWGSNTYYVDRGRRIPFADEPITRPSLTAVVVDSRQPLLLGTLEESEKWGANPNPPSEEEKDQNESVLFVPILAGEKVIGVIAVESYRTNAYNQNDMHLLQTLANSMSVALENARLFDETAQRNAELAVITSVQEALAKQMDIKGIYETLGEKIKDIFDAQAVILTTLDYASSLLLPQYVYEKGERFYPDPFPFTGLIKHQISTREIVVINEDLDAKAKEFGLVSVGGSESSKSAVFVPLVAGDKVIGSISLQNIDRENAFSASDVRLLETLANSMSVALENARLFDETQSRNREITEALALQTATSEILEIIASSPEDIDSVLRTIVEKAALLSNSDDASIGFVEDGFLKARAHYGSIPFFRVGEGILFNRESVAGRAIIDGKPIQAIHNPKGKKSEFPLGDKVAKQFGYAMTVAAPLLFQGKATGAIIIRRVEPTLFSERDISLLQNFANQAAIAIEKARLLNETKRLLEETNQRNAELAVINSVQQGLASRLKFQEIIDLVGEKVGEIFNADTVSAGMYDAQRDWGSNVYYVDRGRRIAFVDGPIPRPSLTAAVIDGRQPLLLGTLEESEKWGAIRNPPSAEEKDQNESVLFVPILAGEKVIGVISVQSYQTNAFNQNDLHLLQTLANSMSVALENARLFDETAQRNAELAVINSVQEALAKELNIQGIYEAVGEKIREIFDAQGNALFIYDPKTDMQQVAYHSEKGKRSEALPPFPLAGFSARVKDTGKSILVNENFAERAREVGAVLIGGGQWPKSYINVPIQFHGNFGGNILIENIDQENAFSLSDVRLLETLANSMSVALENARLFDETARRNAELAVINSVQETIARQMDMQGIYEAVGEKIKDIFDAQSVLLATLDETSNLIMPRYSYEKGERLYPSPTPGGKFAHDLITTRKTIVVNQGFAATQAEYGFEQQPDWGAMPKSAVFVPLIARDNLIGMISLQNVDKENAFSTSDVRLLETLANSMSVALENARLFNETSQRNAELAVINSVQEALAKQLDIKGIYETLGDKIKDIFDAQAVILTTLDYASSLVLPHYLYEKGERFYPKPFPFTGLIQHMISTHETVVINEDFDAKAEEFGMILAAGENAKSAVFVPLVAGDKVIGSISLQNIDRENAFSAPDVRLLETLANSMSVALENARLFDETNRLLEETQEKAAELTTINTVGQALASELELDALIELIGEQVRQIFKVDIVHLALYNKEKDLIEFPYSFGESLPPLKMGEGVVSRVIREAKPVLINRDEAWKETEQKIERVGIRSLSYLGVPILSGKSALGALIVESINEAGRFGEADVRLLSTIAANVGVAIRNAQLFEEAESRKQYFEALFTNNPVAVVATDFAGKIISWNPTAEALFGYTLEEAVGRDLDDLVARDPSVEAEARGFSRKYQAELSGIRARTKRTRKDGSLVDVELMGLPVTVAGENVGFLAIYHDISEIEQARRAAEEANQAKSAFLANMSHELRTPLNAIIGFTRIVKRKGAEVLPEKQTENLDKVLISAEHLLGLINTILDIAKIEAGRMELQLSDFNLDALIDGCLATTQPLLKADSVKLLKSLPKDMPQMHSDQEKLRQILLNLLSNAAKFTHAGSIRVEGKLGGDTLTLAVQDTGIGIAEENLHKIFEEFQQADSTTTREYGGTGLGLSISRSLARLLGGDLTASSVEGQGSTFSLTIPLRRGKPGSEALGGIDGIAEAAKVLEPNKPLVLVIDDQPDMFHILQQNLEGSGYQVVGALSGEEGIEMARTLHPYAITLDIMMPRKDGWQVLYELKNDPVTKDIPVIILTIIDNKAMGFRLGASDYLVKPLDEKLVLEALERITKSNGGVRPRRLLVVDDDPKVVDLIQQMLEGEVFAIETAKDGAEALMRIEQSAPDVILLDLVMPKMDGFQFIEEMENKPKLRKIPIIVLTAKSLTNDELSQLQNSVAKIIKKQGLGSNALIEEIHKIMARDQEPA